MHGRSHRDCCWPLLALVIACGCAAGLRPHEAEPRLVVERQVDGEALLGRQGEGTNTVQTIAFDPVDPALLPVRRAEIGCGDSTGRSWKLRRKSAGQLAKALDGYRTMRRYFRIEAIDIDCGALGPPSLRARLRARTGVVPNGVEWIDPLECCWEPTATWHDLLALYESGRTVVSRHRWLADWASQG